MRELSLDEIIEIFLDTPLCPTQRLSVGPNDWGDQGTVKLQVKRVGATPLSPWNHFGTYFGKHPIGYVVAVKDLHSRPVSGEVFETIEEMKLRWELD